MINCNNYDANNNCLTYVTGYISNFEYISQGILNIINQHILPDLNPIEYIEVLEKDEEGNCVCKPICIEEDEEGCLETADANVFNCVTWGLINKKLIVPSEEDAEEEHGFLPMLCRTLECLLKNTPNLNHGFASQLERFLCLCKSLETRLDSVCCNSKCPELIGDLLCLLMQILTKLISTITKAATLVLYSNPKPVSDECPINKRITISAFIECMLCDFINDLCELEQLVPELSAIVVGFATCDAQSCTPCYTASNVPRKVRPICPTNISNPGMNYKSGHGYGGCGCKR